MGKNQTAKFPEGFLAPTANDLKNIWRKKLPTEKRWGKPQRFQNQVFPCQVLQKRGEGRAGWGGMAEEMAAERWERKQKQQKKCRQKTKPKTGLGKGDARGSSLK